MAYGPAAGLALADQLLDVPALEPNYLLPAVRGDLFHRLGRHDAARDEFGRAAGLTNNQRERETLLAGPEIAINTKAKVDDALRIARREPLVLALGRRRPRRRSASDSADVTVVSWFQLGRPASILGRSSAFGS